MKILDKNSIKWTIEQRYIDSILHFNSKLRVSTWIESVKHYRWSLSSENCQSEKNEIDFSWKKRKEKKREHFVVRINFIESHSMLRIVFSVHYFDFISTRMYRVRYFTFIMLLLPTNSTLKQKFNCSKWNESEYKHQALALKIQKKKRQRYGKYNKIAELNKRQGWQNSVIFRINEEQKRKQKCEKKEQTNECLKSKGIFTIDALHHNCDSSTVHRTEVEREGSKQCNIKSWNGILPQDNG